MPKDTRFTVETKITSFAVTTRHGAVIRIGLNEQADRGAESELERRVSAELQEYAAGERTHFMFPIAPEGTEFDRSVWTVVSGIPYGQTKTYGEIARFLGKPGAARAVGSANGRNPVPPVIPCHRVVTASGKLGGYGGGLDLKRRLLDLETVVRARRGFGVLALMTAALLSFVACWEPSRPVFTEAEDLPDTSPPTIDVLSPPEGDSIYQANTTIHVTAHISDPSLVRSIAASVVGVIRIDFESLFPMDTAVTVQYPIPIGPNVGGRFQINIVALDTLFNRAQVVRPFVIQ